MNGLQKGRFECGSWRGRNGLWRHRDVDGGKLYSLVEMIELSAKKTKLIVCLRDRLLDLEHVFHTTCFVEQTHIRCSLAI